jgi:hypothetical protein
MTAAVPVRKIGREVVDSRTDSTRRHGSLAWLGDLEVGERESPRLGFEARKKKGETKGAPAMVRSPSKGPVCVYYTFSEDKYTSANQGNLSLGKWVRSKRRSSKVIRRHAARR